MTLPLAGVAHFVEATQLDRRPQQSFAWLPTALQKQLSGFTAGQA